MSSWHGSDPDPKFLSPYSLVPTREPLTKIVLLIALGWCQCPHLNTCRLTPWSPHCRLSSLTRRTTPPHGTPGIVDLMPSAWNSRWFLPAILWTTTPDLGKLQTT